MIRSSEILFSTSDIFASHSVFLTRFLSLGIELGEKLRAAAAKPVILGTLHSISVILLS